MKLIGGDAGRYEHEQWVDDVVVAPSERSIVDVLLEDAGTFTLLHRTPGREYPLATITVADPPDETVAGPPVTPAAREAFGVLGTDAAMVAERARAARYLDTPPDRTLALVAEMSVAGPGAAVYVCPMHPEVVRDEPGRCPVCGMKLRPPASGGGQGHGHAGGHGPPDDHARHEGHAGHAGDGDALFDGVEWEDLMPEVNRATTTADMHWKAVDRATGRENAAIDWVFDAGDLVKIRLVNEMDSDHPMHHPFHIHGQRFLVLARDGAVEPNLVWKDTVLIRTGQTVHILLDASNPGRWMAHCHIPEHMEAGMMFSFDVRRAPA
jgi:FtsP/CotA-like multicopper oxidase with cupredoxin domain